MRFRDAGQNGEADVEDDGMPDNPFADGPAQNDTVGQRPSTWTDRFRSRTPNPPIDEVGSFDDIRTKYDKYGLRGLQKLAGVDDTEAWVDLLKFVIGGTMHLTGAEETDVTGGSDDGDETDGVQRAGQVPSIDELEDGP
jgi:hypothetical protein